MWFECYKIEALEQALKSNQKSGLLNLLPSEKNTAQKSIAFCPKCGKSFLRKRINFISSNVLACPEGHGFWLSEDNITSIRKLLNDEAIVPKSNSLKNSSFQMFVFLVGVALIVFNVIHRWAGNENSSNRKMAMSMRHDAKVSPSYWPSRDFSHWNILPVEQNVIVDSEELSYFHRWMVLANEGIVNRLNMHDALLTKRPAHEYLETYHFFVQRQIMIESTLSTLIPPRRLEAFHDYVLSAISNQIDFYDEFVRQKVENSKIELKDLMAHPKLLDCDQKLWAAFYEFARIYPNRDTETNNAIEQRLSWLDLI